MDASEKMKICKAAALAILADGQITDDEHRFIGALMDRYELSEDQRKEVMQRNIGEDPATLVEGISSFESKNELIVELVMAVAADNELTQTEMTLLDTVAGAIGVDKSEMEMLVKNALM